MQTLQILKRQIDLSVQLLGVVKTTKTMAAVAWHQFGNALASLEHYEEAVSLGLGALLGHQEEKQEARDTGPAAVIAFGPDHGLCGRFTDDVALATHAWMGRQNRETLLAVVGARLAERLEDMGHPRREVLFSAPSSVPMVGVLAQEILLFLDALRQKKPSGIGLIYARHQERLGLSIEEVSLIPVHLRPPARPAPSTRSLPLFPASRQALLSTFISERIVIELFRAVANSAAAEAFSRLSAMQAAETHLDEHIADLDQKYRASRQEKITGELLEIVSGFEAILARKKP